MTNYHFSEKSLPDEEYEPALQKNLKHLPYQYRRPSEAEIRKRAKEFFEIVNTRRTLRFFNSDPVPKDVIHNIIKAAGALKIKNTLKLSYFKLSL